MQTDLRTPAAILDGIVYKIRHRLEQQVPITVQQNLALALQKKFLSPFLCDGFVKFDSIMKQGTQVD